MNFENPFGIAELIELAGSAAVVLLMIGVAAFLGFRVSARIDDDELVRLAGEEGARIEASVIAQNGRSALARLSDGRIMVARVMGADVSARFTRGSNVRIDLKGRRLNAAFADAGFPPLKMRLDDSPAWLAEFSRGGGTP
jgi:phosphohistidine swiveling domain-containing protein